MGAMRDLLRRLFLERFFRSAVSAFLGAAFLGHKRSQAQSANTITGFDHVAVPMRNSEAMVRFYRALGLQVNEGERICSVHFGDHKINFHRPGLWQNNSFTLRASGARPPCGDFCFVWNGTDEALGDRIARAEAEIVEGPVDRRGGRDGGRATGISRYTRDPDGNLLEFIIY